MAFLAFFGKFRPKNAFFFRRAIPPIKITIDWCQRSVSHKWISQNSWVGRGSNPSGEGAPPKSATECIHIWFNLIELTFVIIRVFA